MSAADELRSLADWIDSVFSDMRDDATRVRRIAADVEVLAGENRRLRTALDSIACQACEGPEVYAMEGRPQRELIRAIGKTAAAALAAERG